MLLAEMVGNSRFLKWLPGKGMQPAQPPLLPSPMHKLPKNSEGGQELGEGGG